MPKSWTAQVNQNDRARKAEKKARAIRARKTRADNRRHALQHPIRHIMAR